MTARVPGQSTWDEAQLAQEIQHQLKAQGGRADLAAVARALGCSEATASRRLLIARSITRDVLARIGGADVLGSLPPARLIDAARLPTPGARSLYLHLVLYGDWPAWAEQALFRSEDGPVEALSAEDLSALRDPGYAGIERRAGAAR